MKFLFIFISSFVLLTNLHAQTIIFNEDSTVAAIENNRVYFPLLNNGVLADANEASFGHMDYDGKMALFAGGFFLSGYKDTTLWVDAVASSTLLEDFQPGKVGTTQNDSKNKIYFVKASDPPFGKEWQNWKTAVEQGAYFYDGDNDGIYNPFDKNNNGQWDDNEDKPDIIYDASLFTVYHDNIHPNDQGFRESPLVGVEVRQTVFVSNRNTILDDVVFARYSIVYKGLGDSSEPDSLTDVIFSIWSDADIGDPVSDLSGCDTLLQSGYTYNDSSDAVFDSNPPAVFKTIVQGPLVKSNDPNDRGYNKLGPDLGEKVFHGYKNVGMKAFVNNVNAYPTQSPDNVDEARNFMLGHTGTGVKIDPCNWIFGGTRGDIDCSTIDPKYWYSGDPVANYGWINSPPLDQRDLTSTGKFTLHKNEPMDIIVAYTVGRGTDALNSITVARETVQYIHEEYERNFSTIVGVEEEKEELPSTFTLYQNYPNPFNPSTTIKFTIPTVETGHAPSLQTSLIVYDILGREIKTLLNKQLQPGEYEIEFNASDLPSGVYFYRLNTGKFSESRKMLLLK